MIEIRPILLIVGILLVMLGCAMLVPAAVDAAMGHADWQTFVASAAVTFFVGIMLVLSCRSGRLRLTIRQAFLLTSMSWLVLTAFGALPFAFSEMRLSVTDAFFEAMSGVTTTGSTVIVGLQQAPPGILLWRALLQWLGGIGFIVTAIGLLPVLRVGGMQLFRMESSDRSEKALPRVAQIATSLTVVYIGLTAAVSLALWLAGMSGFDAVAHAMTTIATAGFSTYDASVAYFDSAAIDIIITIGMVIASLPFVLYLKASRGHGWVIWRDAQVRGFLGIVALLILFLTGWQVLANDVPPLLALRQVAFNTVSVITGTGFTTANFDEWGTTAVVVFLAIMFIGGCAGSTSCSIKIFRWQVLYAMTSTQIGHLLQPRGVFIPYWNGHPVPTEVADSVIAFIFVFFLSFLALAVGLSLLGLDFLTSVSAAATALCNVGPGLGPVIGPAGNFASLPDAAKWMLSAGMLLGRLELFTVLVLLAPSFWRE